MPDSGYPSYPGPPGVVDHLQGDPHAIAARELRRYGYKVTKSSIGKLIRLAELFRVRANKSIPSNKSLGMAIRQTMKEIVSQERKKAG